MRTEIQVQAGETVANLWQFDGDEVIEDIGIGVDADKRRVVEPR